MVPPAALHHPRSVQPTPAGRHKSKYAAARRPSLSGTVAGSARRALNGVTEISGITISLTGTHAGAAITGGAGNCLFGGLRSGAAGGNYTVTPSRSGYTFSPASRTYNNLSANQTGVDLTATLITFDQLHSGRFRDTGASRGLRHSAGRRLLLTPPVSVATSASV